MQYVYMVIRLLEYRTELNDVIVALNNPIPTSSNLLLIR